MPGKEARRAAAYTLGCKVNLCDTESILEMFRARGFEIVDFEAFAHIYIINTCTVTGLSDKKSRQLLRRARAKNPDAVIVACGCYAQVSPGEIAAIPEVDLIFGTKNRLEMLEMLEELGKPGKAQRSAVAPLENSDVFEELPAASDDDCLRSARPIKRTRAFLKIQDGCENYCSYCVIPYARGKVKSRAEGSALAAARGFAARGYKEIVLTGIHLASYGKDIAQSNGANNAPLLNLIYKIHDIGGIRHIRLGSLEPAAADAAFIGALRGLPKVCPHFHLSLQSGCDRTLKRMNRRYTAADYAAAARVIRTFYPDAAVTTDIITGFPGETEQDFLETCRFIREIGLARIHVFPFSPRKGTPAALFPDQVPAGIKRERAARLIAIGAELERAFLLKHDGKRLNVLFEELNDGFFEGYTDNYIRVRLPEGGCGNNIINEIVEVTAVQAGEGFMLVKYIINGNSGGQQEVAGNERCF